MRKSLFCLLLGTNMLLCARTPSERLTWATEVDLLPIATGGWYASAAAGRGLRRARLAAAEVHIPDAFAPSGWNDAQTQAQAFLVDRFFRPGFTGPWIGGGLEHWDERLQRRHSREQIRLDSLQATLGAGWAFPLGKGFTVNPWLAVHQRIAGDREVSVGQATCRPKALQAEASIKLGYTFR